MSKLKVTSDAELLSYIINSDPVLSAEIDLPKQGEDIAPIGKIILNNQRYRNAFINAVNVIGLTLIHRNEWDNPWEEFANRGTFSLGQSVREMIMDLPEAHDYNANVANATRFLETQVPNVYEYIHDINYQKFYETTTSDEQVAMAFNTEGGLLDFIQTAIGMLEEARKYDKYIVDKYQLCRRILDGTVTSIEIDNYSSLTVRQRVAKMKAVCNKMAFRSPNYNPAGIRVATKLSDQIVLLDTDFDADMETEVLATSFFQDAARFKTNMAMIDGWNNHDTARLITVLGSQYVPFTEGELTALGNVAGMIIDREFFQDYTYSLDNAVDPNSAARATEFFNPSTLQNNHFLHFWGIMSTSPFKQAAVFTKDVAPAVSAVSVSPSTASVTVGQTLKLSATTTTAGFANKAVYWDIAKDGETREGKKAYINQEGVLTIPAGHITGNGTQGTYVLTIGTALAADDTVVIAGIEYTPAADDDTAAEQAAALATAFGSDARYTVTQGTSGNANKLTFVEKSGYYGIGAPVIDDSDMLTGKITESTTTPGVPDGNVVVKATSVFNKSVSGTATITAVAAS